MMVLRVLMVVKGVDGLENLWRNHEIVGSGCRTGVENQDGEPRNQQFAGLIHTGRATGTHLD